MNRTPHLYLLSLLYHFTKIPCHYEIIPLFVEADMNQGMLGVWESEQTLRELISRERDGRKCLRLQLLYLLATKQATNRTTAAKLLGINRQTVGQWLSAYEEGGLASILEIGRPSGLPSSLPDFVIEA